MTVAERGLQCSEEHFLKALDIFIRKPNCSNSKVKGAMILSVVNADSGEKLEDEGLIFDKVNCQVTRKVVGKSEEQSTIESLKCVRLPSGTIQVSFNSSEVNFQILKSENNIQLLTDKSLDHHELESLKRNYFSPLVKWASTDSINATAASVRLVPLDKYTQRYDELKAKYAKKIAEVMRKHDKP